MIYPDKERLHRYNDIFNISSPPPESFVDLHSESHIDAYTILDGMFTDVGRDLNQMTVGPDYIIYNGNEKFK